MNSFTKATATFIAEQSNKELWICDENLFPPDNETAAGQNINDDDVHSPKGSLENVVISDIGGEHDTSEVEHVSDNLFPHEGKYEKQLLIESENQTEDSEERLTEDEQLYLKRLLQCNSSGDQSSKVEDPTSPYISKASGEGFLHTGEETIALQEIDEQLKSLLTSEEYKQLNSNKEFDMTGETNELEELVGDIEGSLSDVNKKLEDLTLKYNRAPLSDEELSTLIGDTSEQLEQLKKQGKNLPSISEELIKQMVDEIQNGKMTDEVQSSKVADEVQGGKVIDGVQDQKRIDEVGNGSMKGEAQDEKTYEEQNKKESLPKPVNLSENSQVEV